ncbi:MULTISPECIES: methionine ABC transporter ATP-binding protein [Leptotrichia]|jgi:methionine import ATP-binding protein metN|uniref:ABC transporter n=1 Tax=Leptotrichia wadei TaxID=157687 RepID=A0A510KTZ5_9FUSO|nr:MULTISPECIES: ATP-binding cassette domain-containing protein [Leptotrichia]NWO27140.1 ATP-binding cassette domain-containing protein [Leptotrichia sp. oral taxon 417]BBM54717.1 ABC transporter [Leptotrichia wadei]VTX47240.1 Methionine import ATP-binding protein MetN [uncultured Leptotrichia sp.]
MEGFIKIKNLVKKYQLNNGKELLAVNNVNLDIEQGDIYGIMGLSGAGKSTLIRLLNRLEEPTSGEILVKQEIVDKKDNTVTGYEDKNILKFNMKMLREYRKKTGMIFQHFNLLNSRNVAENVAFPLEISKWKKKDIEKRVDELLEIVGLSDKKLNYPEQLSGGQKQRVAIARALANNPKILLSDEATSALDPRTTNSILELLKDINKKFGITIILITHQMEVIKKICNKTAIMSDGQIIEKGETKEIFLNPKTDLAKEFVGNISHEEFRTEEEKKHREENNGKLRLRLKYNEDQVNESYITKIIRKYDVEVNILSGFIDKVGDVIVGNLLIEISASEEKSKDIIEWLKENKIDSEVL